MNDDGNEINDGFGLTLSGGSRYWTSIGLDIFVYAHEFFVIQDRFSDNKAGEELIPLMEEVMRSFETSIKEDTQMELTTSEYKLFLFAINFSARFLFTDEGERWFIHEHFPARLSDFGLDMPVEEVMSRYQQFAGYMLEPEELEEDIILKKEVAEMVDRIFG